METKNKSRILIVEDERLTAEDIKETLTDYGYQVVGIAASGEQAIKRTKEHSPELILMDICIKGDIDGIETAKMIRPEFDIPIIFMSAYSDEAMLEKAKMAGPFGYIVKPFEERTLYTTIEMALYKRKMEREKDELQQELFFSAKLAEIGTLAAGVAHELNGPLQGFKNAHHILFKKLKKLEVNDESINKQSEHMNLFLDRMATLIKQIKNFARKEENVLSEVDINETIKNGLIITSHRIHNQNIDLRPNLGKDLPLIQGKGQKLEQISINMINNACDAIGKDGYIEVRTFVKDDYLYIEWENNGPPIPKEVIEKIFNPFFTTKEKGVGTGLGLNISHKMAKEHGGDLSVLSTDEKTVFTLKLPI